MRPELKTNPMNQTALNPSCQITGVAKASNRAMKDERVGTSREGSL